MKAEKMFVKVWFPELVGEPDQMNSTTLYVNGEKAWPVDNWDDDWGKRPCVFYAFEASRLEEGDTIELNIPSGTLTGEVFSIRYTDDEVEVYLTDATWEGLAGGLAGGLSGCCHFGVEDGIVVESSTLEEGQMIDYGLYEDVRQLTWIAGDDKQAVMTKIFELLVPYAKVPEHHPSLP